MCSSRTHKLREANRILALGRERSFSGTCTVEHRRLTWRLNAALCLPERRELRLPSVNMSAWIFHPRCRRRHASFAPLSCVLHRTSILLRRPPRINSVCRLLSHFPFLWNSIFDLFLPPRVEVTLEILGRKSIGSLALGMRSCPNEAK